jgi:hypothetical protein
LEHCWCPKAAPRKSNPQFFSQNCRIEVIPTQILALNEVDLPVTRPFLHRLLALNGEMDEIKIFKSDKSLDPVFLREAFDGAFLVLRDARWKINSYADVQRAVGLLASM